MRSIWDRQDPSGPNVVPMNFVIWVIIPINKWQQSNFYVRGMTVPNLKKHNGHSFDKISKLVWYLYYQITNRTIIDNFQ